MKVFSNNHGQVVVEYTLMLVAVVSMAVAAFSILKTKFVADANCGPGTINPTCYIRKIGFDETNGSGFKRFTLIGGK